MVGKIEGIDVEELKYLLETSDKSVSSIAKFLQISRPTLYKAIRLFGLKFRKIRSK